MLNFNKLIPAIQTKNLEEILKNVDKPLAVKFALHCAKDCFGNIDKVKYPELHEKTRVCLDLVGDYLLGKPITNEELNGAASAASAAYSAANAAYSTTSAAYSAASAASAAYSAANAAYSATSAAYSAANSAANSATSAAYSAAKNKKLEELTDYLVNLVTEHYSLNGGYIKALYA